jgi:hypothetical protein
MHEAPALPTRPVAGSTATIEKVSPARTPVVERRQRAESRRVDRRG